MTNSFTPTIRTATPSDMVFVASSWRSCYRSSHFAGPIPMDLYNSLYRDIISRVLARRDIQVRVSAKDEDIFGYVVFEHGVLHWLYVKDPYRRLGCARALFESAKFAQGASFVYTFKTADAAEVIRKKHLMGKFNPMIVRYAEDKEIKEHDEGRHG